MQKVITQHYEDSQNVYSSQIIIRILETQGRKKCADIEGEWVDKTGTWKVQGHSQRMENNIKMDLTEYNLRF
jgi:hypothetical protein